MCYPGNLSIAEVNARLLSVKVSGFEAVLLDEDELVGHMEKAGTVERLKIVDKRGHGDHAFVWYLVEDAAKRAVVDLEGSTLYTRSQAIFTLNVWVPSEWQRAAGVPDPPSASAAASHQEPVAGTAATAVSSGGGRGGAGRGGGGRGGRGGRGNGTALAVASAFAPVIAPVIASEDDTSCIICQKDDMPRSHAFVPCGHVCVCASCGDAIMNDNARCPICRKPSQMCMQMRPA